MGQIRKEIKKMEFREMDKAYKKALENGDIHEARYYRNLMNAYTFDKYGRQYDPSEFGGWNHGKS